MKKLFILFAVFFIITGCGRKNQNTPAAFEPSEVLNESEDVLVEESVQPISESIPDANQAQAIEKNPSRISLPPQTKNAQEQKMCTDKTLADKIPADGPSSEEIQTALKNAGFYQGNIDGKIGPKSKKAIEDFQAANGLKADGKIGPKTWEKLKPSLDKDTQAVTTAPAQATTPATTTAKPATKNKKR